jgi:hypothetical protein
MAALVWAIYSLIREGFEHGGSRKTRRRWLKDFSLGDLYLSLLNGSLDWLSRLIGDGGHRKAQPLHQSGLLRAFGHNPWTPESYDLCLGLAFLYPILGLLGFWVLGGGAGALGELVLALVFLVLVTAATVALVALANRMALLGGGVPLVDLDGVLLGIAVAPGDPRHYWVYLMLLSTLVPTLVHLFIAGIAATLWLGHFPPLARWRAQVAEQLEDDADARSGAAAYLTATVLAGTLVPLGLLWLAWRWAAALWDWNLLDTLLDMLRLLARLIDPCLPKTP